MQKYKIQQNQSLHVLLTPAMLTINITRSGTIAIHVRHLNLNISTQDSSPHIFPTHIALHFQILVGPMSDESPYAPHIMLTLPPVSFFSGNKIAGKVDGSSKPCRSATTRCIAMQNSSKLRALSLLISDRCLREKEQTYYLLHTTHDYSTSNIIPGRSRP